jgi:hypothetical protein
MLAVECRVLVSFLVFSKKTESCNGYPKLSEIIFGNKKINILTVTTFLEWVRFPGWKFYFLLFLLNLTKVELRIIAIPKNMSKY